MFYPACTYICMMKLLCAFSFVAVSFPAIAQTDQGKVETVVMADYTYLYSDSIPYSKDFKFTPGIYLSFQDFKNNGPIPVSRIVSNYDKNSLDFFKKELQKAQV